MVDDAGSGPGLTSEGEQRPSQDNDETDHKRFLRRGASTAFVLQASANVLQYLVQLVMARVLGVDAFGTYTYAITWTRVAGDVCDLGTTSSSLRLLPEYTVQERWPLSAGVLLRSRQVAMIVGGLVALVASVVLLAVTGMSESTRVLILALILVPVVTLIELQTSLIRAFERVFKAFFPWLVFQPLVLMAGLGAAYAAGVDLDARGAMTLTAVSFAVTVALQFWWLSQAVPAMAKVARPAYAYREWAKVSLPIFGSNVVSSVFSRFDIVMVGLLMSPTEAGIYAVAMRAGMIAALLQTAICANLAPRMSKLYWADRHDELEELVQTALRWVFIPSVVVTAGLVVLAGPALRLFGKPFAGGTSVLVIIAVCQLVGVSAGPVGWLLNMTGHQNVTATVFAVTAAVTMVAYFVLIPWLGVTGAALANGGAVVMRSLVLNQLARRRLGFRISVVRSLGLGLRR
ncbi:MAG TPA: flippase [Acidimicrobiales bacterium]|nr:flippase [Acidimicrobiales bacterium]